MTLNRSVQFFDEQFQRQVASGDLILNSFEEMALPHLRGRVLDFGCGMGNLSVAAARRGCSVVALDGSSAAINHLQRLAKLESLAIEAIQSDLQTYEIAADFDAVVCIGLLMFFDCASALRIMNNLKSRVRAGGFAIINVLIEGTTYLEMFDPAGYCLFSRSELEEQFAGWKVLHSVFHEFNTLDHRLKSFATLIAQKPHTPILRIQI